MPRSARARHTRARIAVLATALLASGAALHPVTTARAATATDADRMDVAPNWRAVPRQVAVAAVGPTGYAHETEDPHQSYGGKLEWTDFADPAKSFSLGYDKGALPFAQSGTGGRYLYVRPGVGLHALHDLETGTERPFVVPQGAAYIGLFGETLLFREGPSATDPDRPVGYYLTRADDPDGARAPVTGWPEQADLDQARITAGDASTAVFQFARFPESVGYGYSDLGLVDLRTGRTTVIQTPVAHALEPVGPVTLSPERLAWVDRNRTVHLRDRSDPTGAERTFPLPEGLGTERIGLVGDWVLALGDFSGTGSVLRRKLVALHPDGRAQHLLDMAEEELNQIPGGGVAVVGGSSSADWALLKVLPGKGDGAPVLEKLRRIEPLPATVDSLALGGGHLSTLETNTSKGLGLYGRTLPVGPVRTGSPEPVWAGAERGHLGNDPTPLFATGDGRTVYVAGGADARKEVVARASSGREVRIPTRKSEGRIADAFGRWAVFHEGRTSAPGQITSGATLVLDLDAGTTVVTRTSQTAAALWGDTLYEATAVPGEVVRTDLATGKALAKVATGAECRATELQVTGHWLYWACSQFLQQGVVDLNTGVPIKLDKGPLSGPLLGDGYLVQQSTSYGSNLDLVDFHTGTAAPARPLPGSSQVVSGDSRRTSWTVDRFGGGVAYKDPDHLTHVVWPGVPTSALTAASASAPAAMRPQDGWKASWTLSRPAAIWRLTIRERYSGATVREFGADETRNRIDVAWDGRTAAGRTVANGTYVWELTAGAADGQGRDLTASGTITATGGAPAWRDLAGNDGFGDLLVSDAAGLVSMYRGNGTGGLSARIAGTGTAFPATTVLVPYDDVDDDRCADVLARVGDRLRAYRPGCGKVVSASSPYTEIGVGWGQYDVLTSPGDLDGDGRTDLLARQASTGDVYFYGGTADHRLKARVRIGTNWKLYAKLVGAGDLNGDGRGDLLGVDASGVLWQYHGTAAGGVTARTQVGGGWGVYSALAGTGDLNGDGRADLVARDTTGKLYAYYSTGSAATPYGGRVLIGTGGWNTFTSLF
ncbi:FG-GAP-like repeat-containing protein [Streptomyces sp. NPDC001744]|uniref:FG-GAP-like repeat-containing protein n=1 Tax=Streptomyces sp. NPDC001744 TaxID=3364606 RepID=UPI0036A2705D